MTTTGEQLKMEGIERVTENNEAWMYAAGEVIERLANTRYGHGFTVDDLKGIISSPLNHNSYGAAFNVAAKAGLIKRVGYRKSTSPSAHARVVSVWAKA